MLLAEAGTSPVTLENVEVHDAATGAEILTEVSPRDIVVEGYLLKGAELCERINLFGFWPMAHFYLSEIYFDMADYKKSKDHCNKAISLVERG